jgi:hypothetical protein
VIDRVSGERNPESKEELKHGSWKDYIGPNNRPSKSLTPKLANSKQELFDIIKDETQSLIKDVGQQKDALQQIEVESYLNDRALHLYQTKVQSTVLEYLRNEDTKELLFPVENRFAINPEHEEPSPQYIFYAGDPLERVPDDIKVSRHVALVRFVGKQITTYDNKVSDDVCKRFARVLNKLADEGIWEFGTLLDAMVMPLALFGDGEPWYPAGLANQLLVNEVMSEDDPRTKTPVDALPNPETLVSERGRRILLLAYIGVHPDHAQSDPEYTPGVPYVDATNKHLNDLMGNDLFLDEGANGSGNWDGLPE